MGYENAKRKSRKILHDTMLTLMRTKPARAITVTELCALSQLNRSTFYAHYQTIDQLIDDMHKELFLLTEEYLHITPEEYGKRNETLLTNFLIHICQEDERFRLFLRSGDMNRFLYNLVNYFLHRICPKDASVLERNVYLYHIIGTFTLLCTWIHEDYPCPAHELAGQILDLSGDRKTP